MKQHLKLKLKQQLKLTPQLQQAIRFLQLSAVELEQTLQEALDSNPLLQQNSNLENSSSEPLHSHSTYTERDSKAIDLNHPVQADFEDHSETQWNERESYKPPQNLSTRDNIDSSRLIETNSKEQSLQDNLQWQLSLSHLNPIDILMGEYIIDAIQPNGRLALEPLDIFNSLKISGPYQPEFDEFEAVRTLIQQFQPAGCASIDLSECLCAQLQQASAAAAIKQTAKKLLRQHIEHLAQKDLNKLSRLTHIKKNQLEPALKLIRSLTPFPGDTIGESQTNYIEPDVIVYKDQNIWKVRLYQEHTPQLSLNQSYIDLLKNDSLPETKEYLQQHLADARSIINSLENRNQTLFKVSSLIVKHQQDFFTHGAEAMQPLTQQAIAGELEVHESTISRVTTHKFMRTPRGVYELKYFFSNEVGNIGNTRSATAIQSLIKQLIAAEDSRKPLSDTKISQWLHTEKGVKVARRTVAKYREQMAIPSSSERKQSS